MLKAVIALILLASSAGIVLGVVDQMRTSGPPNLTVAQVKTIMAGSKNLSGKSLENLNLSGQDLANANLAGADLRGSNLDHANLQNAKLAHANLDLSSLIGTNFASADMEGASLRDPIVARGATAKQEDVPIFRGAILKGARILISKNDTQLGADFSQANLMQADFSQANLTNVILKGANLTSANFSDASLCGADVANADFDGAELKNANFDCSKGLEHAINLDKSNNFLKP